MPNDVAEEALSFSLLSSPLRNESKHSSHGRSLHTRGWKRVRNTKRRANTRVGRWSSGKVVARSERGARKRTWHGGPRCIDHRSLPHTPN